ncbi:MAG: ATP-binding protein [Planctomycetes bacterium]|nr:ATP-binding protein [Planctomycetota bacterium]
MASGIGIVFETQVPAGFGKTVLDEVFESSYPAKAQMILKLLDLLGAQGLLPDQEEETKMRLCLDEVLVNAVKHGNKLDPTKKVRVAVYVDGLRWGIRVEDEGPGFDPSAIPNPEDPESLLLERGRGVLIIKSFMDEVHYYDRGNRILMIRTAQPGGDAKKETQ